VGPSSFGIVTVMKIGFGVSIGFEILLGAGVDVGAEFDVDALLVLFELELVGVGAGTALTTVVVTS
jgi:hypothetical protein